MTVNSLQELYNAVDNGQVFRRFVSKDTQTPDTNGTPMAQANVVGMPPVSGTKSTAEAPTRTTTGAINFPTPQGSNNSFLLRVQTGLSASTEVLMLIDILSWQGGLSGTVTGEQTTNLPTAALTRYTNGENVWLGLICWSATGSTAVNVTARYTNQAGTGSRNTTSVDFWGGGLGARSGAPSTNQVQWLPLQSGDYGVRSVEGVTISASTLTAGNFGVFLCKPLFISNSITANTQQEIDQIIQTSSLPEIQDEAYLSTIIGFSTAAGTVVNGYIDILQV